MKLILYDGYEIITKLSPITIGDEDYDGNYHEQTITITTIVVIAKNDKIIYQPGINESIDNIKKILPFLIEQKLIIK